MFSTIKSYVIVGVSALVAMLLGLLRYKSKKLEEAKVVSAYNKAQVKSLEDEKETNEEIRAQVAIDISEIEKNYDNYTKDIKHSDGAVLSPAIIRMLQRSSSKERADKTS